MENKSNYGIYVFLINLILTLFLLTSNDDIKVLSVLMCISSIIAFIFNIYIIKNIKKSKMNYFSLCLNMLLLTLVILFTLNKFSII